MPDAGAFTFGPNPVAQEFSTGELDPPPTGQRRSPNKRRCGYRVMVDHLAWAVLAEIGAVQH